jgi:hypothetical protein
MASMHLRKLHDSFILIHDLLAETAASQLPVSHYLISKPSFCPLRFRSASVQSAEKLQICLIGYCYQLFIIDRTVYLGDDNTRRPTMYRTLIPRSGIIS